jgi:hypothetical protein
MIQIRDNEPASKVIQLAWDYGGDIRFSQNFPYYYVAISHPCKYYKRYKDEKVEYNPLDCVQFEIQYFRFYEENIKGFRVVGRYKGEERVVKEHIEALRVSRKP